MDEGTQHASHAVFYQKRRSSLLLIGAFVILTWLVYFLPRGSLPLLWLVLSIMMPALIFVAYRRRLTLTDSGIEYRSSFSTVRAQWSQSDSIVARRVLSTAFINVEGIMVRTLEGPQFHRAFIPLSLFGNKWREEQLGQIVWAKAPHLFPGRATGAA